jgi:hypothetical protein
MTDYTADSGQLAAQKEAEMTKLKIQMSKLVHRFWMEEIPIANVQCVFKLKYISGN